MSMAPEDALRLPLLFDPSKLRRDLDAITGGQWTAHFNKDLYSGDWSGIALRKPADATHPIQALYPSPTATEWVNAELLERCPYFAEVFAQFQCPVQSARLLKLGAGSIIEEHTDYELSFEDGEVRIHIPVLTSPNVEFYVRGNRILMEEGETWYLNASVPHRVSNAGPTDRVHLVLDCLVNQWVESMFQRAMQAS